jgi:pimeloyl-ACP methyl ester carboxylesterase
MVISIKIGTLLSATYANMFPEKVGRMILDGVVNPIHYFNPIEYFVLI